MSRLSDKQEQVEGRREYVAPPEAPSNPDDGTQLNPKRDAFVPQTKAERREWKRKRDAR
jgi:hypothetical protein